MNTSDIPEDIWRLAQKHIDEGKMAFVTVAEAIYAERLRCTKIDAEVKMPTSISRENTEDCR